MFRKPPAEIRENRKAESDQIYKFKKIEKPPWLLDPQVLALAGEHAQTVLLVHKASYGGAQRGHYLGTAPDGAQSYQQIRLVIDSFFYCWTLNDTILPS